MYGMNPNACNKPQHPAPPQMCVVVVVAPGVSMVAVSAHMQPLNVWQIPHLRLMTHSVTVNHCGTRTARVLITHPTKFVGAFSTGAGSTTYEM